VITSAQFLECLLLEQAIIEAVVGSMAMRKQSLSENGELLAAETICCFLELRAYRSRN
jgi:hypothetical protein